MFFDTIYFGWYKILKDTVYSYRTDNEGIDSKEHAFFISFLLHGINIWSLFRYFLMKYNGTMVNLYWGIAIALTVFGLGYIYFFRKRISKLISSSFSMVKIVISICLTLIYSLITVYLMHQIGDYLRQINFGFD